MVGGWSLVRSHEVDYLESKVRYKTHFGQSTSVQCQCHVSSRGING